MSELTPILLQLFIIFAAARIGGEIMERLHQPAVTGELLAGILIGPYALALIGRPDAQLVSIFHGEPAAGEALNLVYHVIAELGVIILLFSVGLETRASELSRAGWRAIGIAVVGIVAPFALGYGYMALNGHATTESLFVATALVATSVGITARVLRDMGAIQSREARLILGAAVIDDILAMILLASIAALGGGELPDISLGITVLEAAAFTVFSIVVGTRLSRRYSVHLSALHVQNAPFAVSMLFMLGLAVLAAYVGLAAIIGAFLAGMVLAEAEERYELEAQTRPVTDLLVPFFFVVTGIQVDWRLFLDPIVMGTGLVVILLAIVGKLVGCGVFGLAYGARSAAIVGVGMVPRGEVGLIVASLGQTLGVVSPTMFSVVVLMSVATTLVVPPVLVRLYREMPVVPPTLTFESDVAPE